MFTVELRFTFKCVPVYVLGQPTPCPPQDCYYHYEVTVACIQQYYTTSGTQTSVLVVDRAAAYGGVACPAAQSLDLTCLGTVR